ncbi:AI-2E family transporter [Alterinioella nitratireducens]|jgi:predicted PurR-regulated permease PerM|uniref:AI-2E family transporter n=1 Tax=Alterinioella nitratireducens TaxID=2735915 RepID=UPI000C5A3833|nr:AI-2E family transporter [Alterinioella nitratireducens]MAX72885.1 AI-2E family transporter [Nioella sp.]NPD17845.1 AI-2E family transporter [Alterinioella nitratireducens]
MTGPNTLSTLVNAMLMVVLAGYLLKVGQPVLLPILAAVIVVYVLVNLSEALGRLPVIGRLPAALRRFLVLLAFTAALFALTGVVVGTISEILAQAPRYQANIERLVAQMAEFIGVDDRPDWPAIRDATFGRFSVQGVINTAFLNVTGIGSAVFLIIIYSAFLMAERAGFANKLFTALPDPRDAERTAAIIRDVNERIGDYLAVKTLINVLLGSISFVILWAMDVDFPLFWALLIGLLNYIPYVGSLVGVALPVLLSVVQFGELSRTIILAVLLTIAQVSVGNVIEPRLIGRRVNLSPFVVLVALAVWSSLWGVAGALLAVPLTSMLAIVLSAFDATRPIAILMADRVMGAYRPDP